MTQQRKQKLKNSTVIVLFLAITLLCVCCVTKKKTLVLPPYISADECIKKILDSGDTEAYTNLIFFSRASEGDILLYSFFMANHYNDSDAYALVYYHLINPYEKNNIEIDERTLNLALEYLQRGVDLESSNAQSLMSELYINGKYFPQDSVKGFDLYIRAFNKTDSVDIERGLKYLRREYKKAEEKLKQKQKYDTPKETKIEE